MTADPAEAKAAIAHDYASSSPEYARYAEPLVYRYVTEPLARALSDIGGPVLEVASGTGALTRQLRNVVATDLVASQLFHNPAPRRVGADVDRLPFRADSFAAAASAFGINHFPDLPAAIAEMARVAPVVGLLTWERPESPHPPKQIVLDVIEGLAGRARTRAGEVVDELSQATGSSGALGEALAAAGLRPRVEVVEVEVPWPGTRAFIDYRLAMCGLTSVIDTDEAKREAAARIDALPQDSLAWRPRLILGLGERGQR